MNSIAPRRPVRADCLCSEIPEYQFNLDTFVDTLASIVSECRRGAGRRGAAQRSPLNFNEMSLESSFPSEGLSRHTFISAEMAFDHRRILTQFARLAMYRISGQILNRDSKCPLFGFFIQTSIERSRQVCDNS